MNRLDRLTSILIQLQSKRVVKAQEIASRFGVSLRTVYRDMRSLEEAGVPICAEAGSGYSLIDGYRLPPVQFTREEALSMLTAEKLVHTLTDKKNAEVHRSALFKIKAVLNTAEKDLLQNVENQIVVIDNPYLPPARSENIPLQEILEGIAQNRLLLLNYRAGMLLKLSERIIEPVGVIANGNYWYLMGWCRLRKDYRQFRFDRIAAYSFLEERFPHRHPPLRSLLENKDILPLQRAVIRVDKTYYTHLGDQPYYHGFQKSIDCGDQVEMHFNTPSLTGLSFWFMMIGAGADIVSPPELKELVQEKMQKLNARLYGQAYQDPEPAVKKKQKISSSLNSC